MASERQQAAAEFRRILKWIIAIGVVMAAGAILYLARNRMNFLEFYPPLEHVLALALPEASGLSDGSVFKARVKHDLVKRVLARGRSLGIRFMYVLSYGAFPEPVQACGDRGPHDPQLPRQFQGTGFRILVESLEQREVELVHLHDCAHGHVLPIAGETRPIV